MLPPMVSKTSSASNLDKSIAKSQEGFRVRQKWSPIPKSSSFTLKSKKRKEEDWHPMRVSLARCVNHPAFDVVTSSIIMTNIAFIVVETNAAARGEEATWMHILNLIFMFVYCLEIAARFYVDRTAYFMSSLNILDFALVFADVLFQVLIVSLVGTVPSISCLRVFKTVRLVRAVRAFKGFRELWLMLHGFVAAMKAMMWATVLIIVVLLIWSVASVELLDGIAKELAADGVFSSKCERCPQAFETVESSMLTWFAAIFVGDMWTDLLIPILSTKPWTALVVFPTYFCIEFGMLNLILTVIVDRASEARKDDQEQQVVEKKAGFDANVAKLAGLCEAMDKDGSGCLTLEEFQRGYDDYEEFGQLLKVMDVGRDRIETVFAILDQDKSGTVSYAEFVKELHKMSCEESHTLLVFIKHYVEDVRMKVTEQLQLFHNHVQARLPPESLTLYPTETIPLNKSLSTKAEAEIEPGRGDRPLEVRSCEQELEARRCDNDGQSENGGVCAWSLSRQCMESEAAGSQSIRPQFFI